MESKLRDLQGTELALDQELADLKEKNSRLLRLIVALLVLRGKKVNDEIYEFTFPRPSVDRIPVANFVLDHIERENTIILRMRPRRGGKEML